AGVDRAVAEVDAAEHLRAVRLAHAAEHIVRGDAGVEAERRRAFFFLSEGRSTKGQGRRSACQGQFPEFHRYPLMIDAQGASTRLKRCPRLFDRGSRSGWAKGSRAANVRGAITQTPAPPVGILSAARGRRLSF